MQKILIGPVNNLQNANERICAFAKPDYPTVVSAYDGFTALNAKLKQEPLVCVDIETTHVDPRRGRIVLSTWYFPKSDFLITIIHCTNRPIAVQAFGHIAEGFSKCTMIAHNAGFEYAWFSSYGLPRPQEIWCTMVADQKLTQGIDSFRHNIVDTLERRGCQHNIIKGLASDFSNISDYYQLTRDHLKYNADDTWPLYQLYEMQTFLMRTLNQEFWIRWIHMPLVMILQDMEEEGLVVNETKWLQLAEEAENELADLNTKMHQWVTDHSQSPLQDIVPSLQDEVDKYNNKMDVFKERIRKNSKLVSKYKRENKTHIKAYKSALGMLSRAINGYRDTPKPELRINWNSTDQVLELMRGMGYGNVLPIGKSNTTHKYQPSLSKAARQNWLLNNYGHPMEDLIRMLDTYAKQSKHINSFGRGFIEKYTRSETGKVHTSYKQGNVATGRLASGNSKGNPPTFNSQQLPRIVELRECFGTDSGYYIITCDLSGAELITMCSLAQDHKLLSLSKGDMHSYFANKGWKAIYKSRGEVWTEVIDKEHPLRVPYKNMTFGTIYGLKPAKAGETLNVTSTEGGIAITTIVEEIPDTISMVEAASAEALEKGYVIHNKRTNSRRWFKPVIDLQQENKHYPIEAQKELDENYAKIIAQQARNTRVQGTQADMLCEAMVLMDRYIRLNNLDLKILLQVHDEIVVKVKGDPGQDIYAPRVKEIMTRVANKYLEGGVTMDADYKIKLTWTK